MLDLLPSHPLNRAEIRRLRANESIDGFIELVPQARVVLNGGLRRAVALSNGTVVALSFEEGEWTQRVLANDADESTHIDETIKYIE